MPTYRFRCDACGDERVETMSFEQHDYYVHRVAQDPYIARHPMCPEFGTFRQVLSFSFHRSMPDHFNHSLGQPIGSSAQARSVLSRASDAATARTGVPHNYEFVDPREPASIGVTEQGLEATERRAREEGRTEAKKKVIV